jgi:N-dimethylarginine dimethylaminohydrolase
VVAVDLSELAAWGGGIECLTMKPRRAMADA